MCGRMLWEEFEFCWVVRIWGFLRWLWGELVFEGFEKFYEFECWGLVIVSSDSVELEVGIYELVSLGWLIFFWRFDVDVVFVDLLWVCWIILGMVILNNF